MSIVLLSRYNPLLSKQSIFVDIPQYIDLREFCVFSQVGLCIVLFIYSQFHLPI